LHFHKTELSLDDCDTHVVGKIHTYLLKAAASHVGQSKSFADSLFAILSARGRSTDEPANYEELVTTRGYSRSDFMNALEDLRSIPDKKATLDLWLAQLNQKMPIRDLTRLQVRVTCLFEERLRGSAPIHDDISKAVRAWVAEHPPGENVLEFLSSGISFIEAKFSNVQKAEIQAEILLEGIAQCLSQT
jgi:hypothetical protein